MKHINHADAALEAIDRELARPPMTIEDSLVEAVENGRMSPSEAEECYIAYQKCLHKGDALENADFHESWLGKIGLHTTVEPGEIPYP